MTEPDDILNMRMDAPLRKKKRAMNLSEMTGDELDKYFFEKVMGWEWVKCVAVRCGIEGCGTWVDSNEDYVSDRLPQLHASLDEQEKWCWPLLIEKGIRNAQFQYLNAAKRWTFQIGLQEHAGVAETKPLAQLIATLKALEVEG
ncbi:hypothetical protein KAR91_66880 [Candidatus Pacearchaeota archaeon]|nr:hypothetical protein [Candidatus Pacearchaeota archaeon]